MKYFLFLAIVSVHFRTYAFAYQPDSLSSHESAHEIELDMVGVDRVSYLVPVTECTQLSFGLEVNIDRSNGSNGGGRTVYTATDTTVTKIPETVNSFSGGATFTMLYLGNLISFNSLSFYAGAGPYVSYVRAYGDDNVTNVGVNSTTGHESRTSSYSWTYGAAAEIGAQIAVAKNIGVHAEYDFSVGHQKTTSSSAYSTYEPSYGTSSTVVNTNGTFTVSAIHGIIAGFTFFF